MKVQSKNKIYEFLNVDCKEFLFFTQVCAIDYLKDIHVLLDKHLSEIKSGNLEVEYFDVIGQSHKQLMEHNESFEKCTKQLIKLGVANDAYALEEIILPVHKVLLLTVKSHCQFLNLQQLEFMRKGKELADQILQKLGDFIISKGNSSQTMEDV